MKHYGLDPAWYFSAPGPAWDATLEITKVQLQLLSDPDMLLMIESGIIGGIATISHRHAKADNEYIGTEFDPAEKSKFISYLDANNLYGYYDYYDYNIIILLLYFIILYILLSYYIL